MRHTSSLWDRINLIRKAMQTGKNVAVYKSLSSSLCKPEENLTLTVHKPRREHLIDYVYKIHCYGEENSVEAVWLDGYGNYKERIGFSAERVSFVRNLYRAVIYATLKLFILT